VPPKDAGTRDPRDGARAVLCRESVLRAHHFHLDPSATRLVRAPAHAGRARRRHEKRGLLSGELASLQLIPKDHFLAPRTPARTLAGVKARILGVGVFASLTLAALSAHAGAPGPEMITTRAGADVYWFSAKQSGSGFAVVPFLRYEVATQVF